MIKGIDSGIQSFHPPTTGAGNYTTLRSTQTAAASALHLCRRGFLFLASKHWNTEANGSGISYSSGGSYTENAGVTLYAQWNSSTTTAEITLPTPTRAGYVFQGWAKNSSATSGVTEVYSRRSNETLYAEWKPTQLNIIYNSNGATSIRWRGESISQEALTSMLHTVNYSESMPDGLLDGNNSSVLYLERTGYEMAPPS